MLRLRQLRITALHHLLQFNFSALFDCFVRSLHITHGSLIMFRDSSYGLAAMKDEIKDVLKIMLLFRDIFSFMMFVMYHASAPAPGNALPGALFDVETLKEYYRQYEYNIFVFVLTLAKLNILYNKEI